MIALVLPYNERGKTNHSVRDLIPSTLLLFPHLLIAYKTWSTHNIEKAGGRGGKGGRKGQRGIRLRAQRTNGRSLHGDVIDQKNTLLLASRRSGALLPPPQSPPPPLLRLKSPTAPPSSSPPQQQLLLLLLRPRSRRMRWPAGQATAASCCTGIWHAQRATK
jgi:hypothetical protein